jgi:anion-transporting  ArsA/GET3 family ATPase
LKGCPLPRVAPRIAFVMGKGGVGRTTVATALATDFAESGERVLLIGSRLDREVALRLRRAARSEELPAARFEMMNVDEREVVNGIMRRLLKLGPMSEAVIRHPAYVSFTDIAPGIRELGLLNLLYERRASTSSPVDRIVFDAPATGHGLHFLEAPDKASRLLVGILKDRVDAIRAMLHDRAQCEVILVVVPQEVPVRETIELASRLRAQGFPLDNIVVNRWMPRVFADPRVAALLDRLAAEAPARATLSKAVAERSRIDVDQAVGALELVRAERVEAEARLSEILALETKVSLVPTLPNPETRLLGVARALRNVLPPGGVAGDAA